MRERERELKRDRERNNREGERERERESARKSQEERDVQTEKEREREIVSKRDGRTEDFGSRGKQSTTMAVAKHVGQEIKTSETFSLRLRSEGLSRYNI